MEKLDLDLDFEIYIFEEEFKDESITSRILDHKTMNVHVGFVHNMSNAELMMQCIRDRTRSRATE